VLPGPAVCKDGTVTTREECIATGPGEQYNKTVDARQRARALIALNDRTLEAISGFRDELKRTKRWSAAHQQAFNAWKRNLASASERARRGAAVKSTPRAAWDLAVAQAERQRTYWTALRLRARNQPGKKFGPDVFEETGA